MYDLLVTTSFTTLSFYDYLRSISLLEVELSCEEKVVSAVEAKLEILGRCCRAVEVVIRNCEVHLSSS